MAAAGYTTRQPPARPLGRHHRGYPLISQSHVEGICVWGPLGKQHSKLAHTNNKTYNKVKWSFLQQALRMKGFPNKWRQWIDLRWSTDKHDVIDAIGTDQPEVRHWGAKRAAATLSWRDDKASQTSPMPIQCKNRWVKFQEARRKVKMFTLMPSTNAPAWAVNSETIVRKVKQMWMFLWMNLNKCSYIL